MIYKSINVGNNQNEMQFPTIQKTSLDTLQVNLGYKCNQACSHCHVNAGPNRIEMCSDEIIELIPRVLKKYSVSNLDITGGAPELHPRFFDLIEITSKLNIQIIDRCNLTILTEPGFSHLAGFLAKYNVKVIASLPCYIKDNVDKQRGPGVFDRSIEGLRLLNRCGYGIPESGREINLVYNPQGINLPPDQKDLEAMYKEKLESEYGIKFNSLLTITNMPINRFAEYLKRNGQYSEYMLKLINSFNSTNINSLMCKSLISVDWEGTLYDCDFNQQLGLRMLNQKLQLKDLLELDKEYILQEIIVGEHCFGCTAGAGSSCGGALSN